MAEIVVRAIIEMLGKPKAHIEKTLHDYVQKLKDDKIKIQKEKFEEPKPQGELFSVFVELEIQFKSFNEVMDFCLTSLPSSIEIIDPDPLAISAHDLTASLTDLQGHLHEVDMLIKDLRAKGELIDRNAIALFRNFIVHLVNQKPHTLVELSKILGIGEKELRPFLDRMVEMNLVLPDGDLYKPASKE